MRRRRPVSKETTSFLKLITCFFFVAALFRIAFFILFKDNPENLTLNSFEIRKALYIGFKFDLRVAIIICLPYWFLGYSFKLINAVFEEKDRKMFLSTAPHPTNTLKFIFSILLSLYTLLLTADLLTYSDSQSRVTLNDFSFFTDSLTSLYLAGQNHSIGFILLGFAVLCSFFFLIIHKIIFIEHLFVSGQHVFRTELKRIIPIFMLLAALAHGKLSMEPLTQQDTNFSEDPFISSLALNPLLRIYTNIKSSN